MKTIISILKLKNEALEEINKINSTARKKVMILNHFLNLEKVKIPNNKNGIFVAIFAAKILMLPVFPVK
jgi:hypothetical protein